MKKMILIALCVISTAHGGSGELVVETKVEIIKKRLLEKMDNLFKDGIPAHKAVQRLLKKMVVLSEYLPTWDMSSGLQVWMAEYGKEILEDESTQRFRKKLTDRLEKEQKLKNMFRPLNVDMFVGMEHCYGTFYLSQGYTQDPRQYSNRCRCEKETCRCR